jgi:hypothetical protein
VRSALIMPPATPPAQLKIVPDAPKLSPREPRERHKRDSAETNAAPTFKTAREKAEAHQTDRRDRALKRLQSTELWGTRAYSLRPKQFSSESMHLPTDGSGLNWSAGTTRS